MKEVPKAMHIERCEGRREREKVVKERMSAGWLGIEFDESNLEVEMIEPCLKV